MNSVAIERLLRLSDESWTEVVLRLRLHAEFRIRAYTWNARRNLLPRGWTADDAVIETIASVLDGTRAIDLDRHDVLDSLRSIVDSKLDGLARNKEHWSTEPVGGKHSTDSIGSSATSGTMSQTGEPATKVAGLLSRLTAGMAPELVPVFGEMVDGYRPEDIAIRLGQPVESIYVLVRKVRAHVADVWKREGTPDGN